VVNLAALEIKDRVRNLNEHLARYIPPRETWTPAEEALYKPIDLYRVPLDEAQTMQMKAIKSAFVHHYNDNEFYHKLCTTRGVSPVDVNTLDDLLKLPLIPDQTFKQYPQGKDFAYWVTAMSTGDMPQIIIKGANPTFDDVINAFNTQGMALTYSSGTSGRFTVIPRDQRTFLDAEYGLAKAIVTMWTGDIHNTDGYLLMPNPFKTNVFVGRVTSVYFDMVTLIEMAIDRKLTAKDVQTAMSGGQGLKGRLYAYMANRMQEKAIDKIIQWLEQHDKAGGNVSLIVTPYLLYFVMKKLQALGKRFDLGEDSAIVSGGGWKVRENIRLPVKEFRELAYDVLGIPETCCFDCYAMVEGNAFMLHCPEGHYLHVPHTFFKPLILDQNLEPVQYGEVGRFAFLDGLAGSYPGFIITGDEARMLEHCPACDRMGPVLEPEIHRAQGEEVRGCAEEVRRLFSQTVEGSNE
jgi:phenylacetate-coenzyme A ligase PaaK-like adenylate-forming protein